MILCRAGFLLEQKQAELEITGRRNKLCSRYNRDAIIISWDCEVCLESHFHSGFVVYFVVELLCVAPWQSICSGVVTTSLANKAYVVSRPMFWNNQIGPGVGFLSSHWLSALALRNIPAVDFIVGSHHWNGQFSGGKSSYKYDIEYK